MSARGRVRAGIAIGAAAAASVSFGALAVQLAPAFGAPAAPVSTGATLTGAAPAGRSPFGPRATTVTVDVASATTGTNASTSGDGGKVVFVAPSSLPPPAGSPAYQSVWFRDRATHALTELTRPANGMRSGSSRNPVISRDGCTVVIDTEIAFDLFHDDDVGDRWDVYRTVLPGCPGAPQQPGQWELVSTDANGSALDSVDPTQKPTINVSGEIVAYGRTVHDPATQKSTGRTVIDVVDLTVPLGQPGRIAALPGVPAGEPAGPYTYVGQRDPVLSDDGQYVAFTSDAAIAVTLAPAGSTAAPTITGVWAAGTKPNTPAITQVYRWDRVQSDLDDSLPMQLVSAGAAGRAGNGPSRQPSISADGRFVAFSSVATDLRPAPAAALPAGTPSQVYRVDFDPPQDAAHPSAVVKPVTVLVSQLAGAIGDGASGAPSLDATGELVGFLTGAGNLTPVPPGVVAAARAYDVLVADVDHSLIRRATTRPDGSPADAGAGSVQLSATGKVVTVQTITGQELVAPGTRVAPGSQVVSITSPPELTASPLDVGTNIVGRPSAKWWTSVVNNGPTTFVPATISSSDPAIAVTGGTCTPTVPLLPESSCTVEVVFTPRVDGPVQSTLALTEAGYGPASVTTTVSGLGGTPAIAAAPLGNELGEVVVGKPGRSVTINVSNIGVVPQRVGTVQRTGNTPDDFRLDADGCTGHALAPGQGCAITVTFVPRDAGSRSALLTITTADGANSSVVLHGTGTYTPVLGVTPSVVAGNGVITVGGLGFPASSAVTLRFAYGDHAVLTNTTAEGAFLVRLPILPADVAGQQRIIAIDAADRYTPVSSGAFLVQGDEGSPVPLLPVGDGN